MSDSAEKYDRCPLAAAGFRLVRFEELGTRTIGPDGRCVCTATDHCPDVDKRDGLRCSEEHLRRVDSEAVGRRARQSGWDD